MSIIPASSLSRGELRSLGNNVLPTVEHDRVSHVDAVNRSLSLHEEAIPRLDRRAGTARAPRRLAKCA